jgi:hypothetical protein
MGLIMKSHPFPRLLILFAFFLATPSLTRAFDGPLEVANQFPLFIHLNAPSLESPIVRDSIGVNLSYSSLYFMNGSAHWTTLMDLEALTINFRIKKKFGSRLELGLDVPFLSFNSGFMDPFLNWYHEAFGFPDYGRSQAPSNRFLYSIEKNGKPVVEGEPGKIGLGDIRLSGKYALPIPPDFPSLSLKADLELPTGDPKKGYGSGSLDWGVALLFEKQVASWLNIFGSLGLVIPGTWKAHQNIDLKPYYYGGLGLECAITKNISALTQAWIQSSPLPQTNISSLDRPAVLWSFGGRYHIGKTYLELSFTEDPNTAGAPDFTISLGLKKKF